MVRRRRPADGRADNGGPRNPTAGTQYANRSDLQTQPVRTVPGQAYGEAKAQQQSQTAVPLAAQPAPPPPTQTAHQAAAAYQMPTFGDFSRPTERPDEPLTHGAPVGAGAGPEIMPGYQPPAAGISGMLRMIAGATGSSDLEALAQRAQALGQ